MTRKPQIDRTAFPLVYIGPSTKWIATGTALHALRGEKGEHLRGHSGMLTYTTSKGEGVQLPPAMVVPYEPPLSRAEVLMRRFKR